MSIGKSVLKLFCDGVEDDAPESITPAVETETEESVPAVKLKKKNKVEEEESETVSTSSGEMDKDVARILEATFKESNPPGFDYFEFRQMFRDTKDDIPDEGARVRSTLTAAKSMKATSDSIVESAKGYITILQDEKKNILKAVDEKASVDEEKAEEAKSCAKQIVELQSQIDELTKKQAKLEKEAGSGKAKNEAKRISVESTTVKFISEIKKDIERIGKYAKK